MIYIISRGSNHSRVLFIGPTVKYRPKLSFFVKKVENIEILTGFWFTKVENGYINIHIKFPVHTVRIFYKIVINDILRV